MAGCSSRCVKCCEPSVSPDAQHQAHAPERGRDSRVDEVTRLLGGAAIIVVAYAGVLSVEDLDRRVLLVTVLVPFWLICVATTIWATRSSASFGRPVITVALLALAVQLPGVLTPPRSSTDAWRYVWDGRVTLSGTSPYKYVPLDDRLAALRDPILFPGLTPDQRSGVTTTPLPADRAQLQRRAEADGRTVINRPRVPTIYPPVAQLWFAAVAALTPWSLGTLGLQIANALLAVAVAATLTAWLVRRGRNPREALWWAWFPTIVLEAGNGAHVDLLAAALLLGAVVVMTTRPGRTASSWIAGILLGAGVAVKLTPLVVLPAFMPLRNNGFRRSWQAPAATVGTLVASYAPHVLIAGGLVLGYLPGYLSEEGGRNRGGLLRLVVPDSLLTPAMLVAMGAVAIWAVRTTSVEAPQHPALVLFGSLLLVTTPSYPWYAVPLVVLAVLVRRLEWLAVPAAGYLAYAFALVPPVSAIGYGVAAAVVISVATWRHLRAAPVGAPAHSQRSPQGRPQLTDPE